MKKIAYMLDVFPVISETFILHEILALKERGLDVIVFARGRADAYPYNTFINKESASLIPNIYYVDPYIDRTSRFKNKLVHLRLFLKWPMRYIKTFFYAYKKGDEMFLDFKLVTAFIKKMRTLHVNHIHAHFALKSCAFSMLISMITRITYSCSVHAHDIYSVEDVSDDLPDFIRYAKFVVTCTAYNQKYLLETYGPYSDNKIYLNYHGVDTNRFNKVERKLDGVVSILSVGRLVEIKGLNYLIEAVSLLMKFDKMNFSVTIIGDGPEHITLKKQIKALNLEHIITIRGAKALEEVEKEYRYADIFVLPSVISSNGNRDGIPNVLLEAMSCGLTVVSTTVSGIPELITDGIDGFLVPQRDSKALANVLLKVLKDATIRETVGRKAREKMGKKFEKGEQINKLLEIFNSSATA
jgi:glycosyltransferase involved in cell wall biosynthesis